MGVLMSSVLQAAALGAAYCTRAPLLHPLPKPSQWHVHGAQDHRAVITLMLPHTAVRLTSSFLESFCCVGDWQEDDGW